MNFAKEQDLGYFGNIWVRQNHLKNKGDFTPGHIHLFDHVSLLVKGSVEVHVEGKPAKTFTAPTFVVVRKEQKHSFVALEDDTIFYCVFAIRDESGDLTDIIPPTSDPYFIRDVDETYWEKRKKLESMSIEADKPYPPDGNLYTWDTENKDWIRI